MHAWGKHLELFLNKSHLMTLFRAKHVSFVMKSFQTMRLYIHNIFRLLGMTNCPVITTKYQAPSFDSHIHSISDRNLT